MRRRDQEIAPALSMICPTCHAPAGEKCTLENGTPTPFFHYARWAPLEDAYRAGYQEGREDERKCRE